MVKSNKMIHVGMGDENMGDLEQIFWGKGMDVTQVKKKRPFFMGKGHKEARVVKRTIDQPGMEDRGHYEGRYFATCLLMQA